MALAPAPANGGRVARIAFYRLKSGFSDPISGGPGAFSPADRPRIAIVIAQKMLAAGKNCDQLGENCGQNLGAAGKISRELGPAGR